MLSGFNTNVRYRGVRFHVQTEDSGRAHPHVITHLYHEGTILGSQKSGYADRLGSERLAEELRELMETQHTGMVERLRRGEFDAVIEERLGPAALAPKPARAAAPAGATGASQTRPPAAPAPAPSREQAAAPLAAAGGGERPLDELILDYLVESARKRKHRAR